VALLRDNAELASVLEHPAVKPDIKKKIVSAIFARPEKTSCSALADAAGGARPDPAPGRDRGRLHRSPAGVQGRGTAAAVSATAIDENQMKALAKALKEVVGRDVEVSSRVDPALLGGLLVQMQGRTYDGSVRSRLASLRARLAGA
jgi:F-type H+-transporting ATPase subunit delta